MKSALLFRESPALQHWGNEQPVGKRESLLNGSSLTQVSGRDPIGVWDADTGERLAAMAGHTDWVFNIAWSPDGRRLASGGVDNAVRLWDPATGDEALNLPGHRAHVRALAWDRTGRRLASVSEDNTVHIWDGRPDR